MNKEFLIRLLLIQEIREIILAGLSESLIVYYENREEELIKGLKGSKWWQAYRQKTIQSKKCLNNKQQ